MNLEKLTPFIKASVHSCNPLIKKAAETLNDQMITSEEEEEVVQPALHEQTSGKPLGDKPKDLIDLTVDNYMPDIAIPEPDKSEFGKVSAAYSSDVTIGSLPKETQADILKFVPDANKKNKVVLYGMVVDELVPKVDNHNFKMAQGHVTEKINKGKKAAADEFQAKVGNKYILLLNDKIIDGHHFLALAQSLGISCSLKVLDLTPLRFQIVKQSSLLEKLAYGLRNHGR